MGYTKIITYSNLLEYYEYENNLRRNGRGIGKHKNSDTSTSISDDREDTNEEIQSTKDRRGDNVRRAVLVFRRLVTANLGQSDVPIFASFTYAKDQRSVRQGHKDFKAFVRDLTNKFGRHLRYVYVPEFTKRGRLHFHALIWGLPALLVETERDTRVVAGLWKQGFADLIQTDGSHKLASYMTKYMAKTFADRRLAGSKAFVCSRNLIKPYVDKNAILLPYFYGYHGFNLSTATILRDKEFMTQWLGKGRLKLYQTNP